MANIFWTIEVIMLVAGFILYIGGLITMTWVDDSPNIRRTERIAGYAVIAGLVLVVLTCVGLAVSPLIPGLYA